MNPVDHETSLVRRGADHRRSVVLGIGASAALHAALLAWVAFPAPSPPGDASEPRSPAVSDALEVISLRLPDVRLADAAPEDATPESFVALEPSSSAASPSGSLSDARRTAGTSAASEGVEPRLETVGIPRRVAVARSTFRGAEIGAVGEIRAIEPAHEPTTTGHEGHLHTLVEEEGPGFWGRLAEGIRVGVSVGGHCPMDADLIGATRDRGFAIPQTRGGGVNLPRAGGFSIPQSRGLGVRLPGGIGR